MSSKTRMSHVEILNSISESYYEINSPKEDEFSSKELWDGMQGTNPGFTTERKLKTFLDGLQNSGILLVRMVNINGHKTKLYRYKNEGASA